MIRSSCRQLGASALAAFLLASCFSVHTKSRPVAGAAARADRGGGVSLHLYADDGARRAGSLGPRGLMSELVRGNDAGGTPVFRSLEPAWTVMGLPAGKYRLRFPARLDEEGHILELDERDRVLRVREGEVTEVVATVEHVAAAWVAAGVATAVVAAILLEDWLDKHDLPLPPLPPPPPEILDLIFYVTLDIAIDPEWRAAGGTHPPVVTSHFPPDDALVAARRVRITFALSEPLQGHSLRADGVTVLGEASGLVPGSTGYDGERWWVVWEPDADLPRGDTFHVTLAADAVEDLGGRDMATPVSFMFRSTP